MLAQGLDVKGQLDRPSQEIRRLNAATSRPQCRFEQASLCFEQREQGWPRGVFGWLGRRNAGVREGDGQPLRDRSMLVVEDEYFGSERVTFALQGRAECTTG
jgi:hypothetical protein